MKRFYDRGKTTTEVTKGDFVGLKKQPRPSGLDPCYLGPYQVIRRRGVDVEIQVEGRQRLVHLNRCKNVQTIRTSVKRHRYKREK